MAFRFIVQIRLMHDIGARSPEYRIIKEICNYLFKWRNFLCRQVLTTAKQISGSFQGDSEMQELMSLPTGCNKKYFRQQMRPDR